MRGGRGGQRWGLRWRQAALRAEPVVWNVYGMGLGKGGVSCLGSH